MVNDCTFMNYRTVFKLFLTLILNLWLVLDVAYAGSELPRFIDVISAQKIYPEADKLGAPTGEPLVAPA